MNIIAHRGLSGSYQENSCEAFRAAKRAGATYFECDVHLAATGEVMVSHDATLARVFTAHGDIALLSGDELAFFGVPTLRDVCSVIEAGVLVVEIKAHAMAGAVYALLCELHVAFPLLTFVVSSFKTPEVREVARLITRDACSFITCAVTRWGRCTEEECALYRSWGVRELHCNYEDGDCDAAFVRMVHEHDMYVSVYTVNDDVQMQRVKGWGVDGVFTDHADRWVRRQQ